MPRQKIANRLQILGELDGVSVDVSGSTSGTIRVIHNRHHAPEFIFRWMSDHFVGYFIDGQGTQSQAVVSLYSPLDAIHFVSAYTTLNLIRANQNRSERVAEDQGEVSAVEIYPEEVVSDWWENTMDMAVTMDTAVFCSLEKQSDGEIFVVLQYGTKGEKPGEIVSKTIFWQWPLNALIGQEAEDPDEDAPINIAFIGLIAIQQLLEENGIKPPDR